MHINCLELLAATPAVKTFLKDASGVSVLLQLDNATHQQHGGHSVEPVDRAGKGTVDVGSRLGDSPVSPTYSRSGTSPG